MARLLRWIADAPRFVQVGQNGRPTGNVIEGMDARRVQFQLDNGKVLPRGWIRDWKHENGRVHGSWGGRRHAFSGGTSERIRSVSPEDIEKGRLYFDRIWNGICRWRPISKTYVWSSTTWSYMEWVEDEDAPVIFFACYGEFADVTDLAIRDDDDPRTLISQRGYTAISA